MGSSKAIDALEESMRVLRKNRALRGVMDVIIATIITNETSDKLARDIADEIYAILDVQYTKESV